jgi:hypothetical protein
MLTDSTSHAVGDDDEVSARSTSDSSRRSRRHRRSRRSEQRSPSRERASERSVVPAAVASVPRRKGAQSAFKERDAEASKALHAATSVTEEGHKKSVVCGGAVVK